MATTREIAIRLRVDLGDFNRGMDEAQKSMRGIETVAKESAVKQQKYNEDIAKGKETLSKRAVKIVEEELSLVEKIRMGAAKKTLDDSRAEVDAIFKIKEGANKRILEQSKQASNDNSRLITEESKRVAETEARKAALIQDRLNKSKVAEAEYFAKQASLRKAAVKEQETDGIFQILNAKKRLNAEADAAAANVKRLESLRDAQLAKAAGDADKEFRIRTKMEAQITRAVIVEARKRDEAGEIAATRFQKSARFGEDIATIAGGGLQQANFAGLGATIGDLLGGPIGGAIGTAIGGAVNLAKALLGDLTVSASAAFQAATQRVEALEKSSKDVGEAIKSIGMSAEAGNLGEGFEAARKQLEAVKTISPEVGANLEQILNMPGEKTAADLEMIKSSLESIQSLAQSESLLKQFEAADSAINAAGESLTKLIKTADSSSSLFTQQNTDVTEQKARLDEVNVALEAGNLTATETNDLLKERVGLEAEISRAGQAQTAINTSLEVAVKARLTAAEQAKGSALDEAEVTNTLLLAQQDLTHMRNQQLGESNTLLATDQQLLDIIVKSRDAWAETNSIQAENDALIQGMIPAYEKGSELLDQQLDTLIEQGQTTEEKNAAEREGLELKKAQLQAVLIELDQQITAIEGAIQAQAVSALAEEDRIKLAQVLAEKQAEIGRIMQGEQKEATALQLVQKSNFEGALAKLKSEREKVVKSITSLDKQISGVGKAGGGGARGGVSKSERDREKADAEQQKAEEEAGKRRLKQLEDRVKEEVDQAKKVADAHAKATAERLKEADDIRKTREVRAEAERQLVINLNQIRIEMFNQITAGADQALSQIDQILDKHRNASESITKAIEIAMRENESVVTTIADQIKARETELDTAKARQERAQKAIDDLTKPVQRVQLTFELAGTAVKNLTAAITTQETKIEGLRQKTTVVTPEKATKAQIATAKAEAESRDKTNVESVIILTADLGKQKVELERLNGKLTESKAAWEAIQQQSKEATTEFSNAYNQVSDLAKALNQAKDATQEGIGVAGLQFIQRVEEQAIGLDGLSTKYTELIATFKSAIQATDPKDIRRSFEAVADQLRELKTLSGSESLFQAIEASEQYGKALDKGTEQQRKLILGFNRILIPAEQLREEVTQLAKGLDMLADQTENLAKTAPEFESALQIVAKLQEDSQNREKMTQAQRVDLELKTSREVLEIRAEEIAAKAKLSEKDIEEAEKVGKALEGLAKFGPGQRKAALQTDVGLQASEFSKFADSMGATKAAFAGGEIEAGLHGLAGGIQELSSMGAELGDLTDKIPDAIRGMRAAFRGKDVQGAVEKITDVTDTVGKALIKSGIPPLEAIGAMIIGAGIIAKVTAKIVQMFILRKDEKKTAEEAAANEERLRSTQEARLNLMQKMVELGDRSVDQAKEQLIAQQQIYAMRRAESAEANRLAGQTTAQLQLEQGRIINQKQLLAAKIAEGNKVLEERIKDRKRFEGDVNIDKGKFASKGDIEEAIKGWEAELIRIQTTNEDITLELETRIGLMELERQMLEEEVSIIQLRNRIEGESAAGLQKIADTRRAALLDQLRTLDLSKAASTGILAKNIGTLNVTDEELKKIIDALGDDLSPAIIDMANSWLDAADAVDEFNVSSQQALDLFERQKKILELSRDLGRITEQEFATQMEALLTSRLEMLKTEETTLIAQHATQDLILDNKIAQMEIELEILNLQKEQNNQLGKEDKLLNALIIRHQKRIEAMRAMAGGAPLTAAQRAELEAIRMEMVRRLQDTGATQEEIDKFLASLPKFQTGGPTTGGPAMLHPGEYVLSQSAAEAIGRQTLDWLNSIRPDNPAAFGRTTVDRFLTNAIQTREAAAMHTFNIAVSVNQQNDFARMSPADAAVALSRQTDDSFYRSINDGIRQGKIRLGR